MNGTTTQKAYRTEMRFRNKKQRNDFKKVSKQNGRSMNAQLNVLVDDYLDLMKKWQPAQ